MTDLGHMLPHLPAILLIVATLALYAFYALFIVAGLVLAVNLGLELLHKLLERITGGVR
jgi:hypothetical protein